MATLQGQLNRFYIEVQDWIDAGAPENHPVFDPEDSLCYLLVDWALANDLDDDDLRDALDKSFVAAGLDRCYPFNGGDEYAWATEDEIYANPARLAWIKQHAEAAKATGQAVPA